MYVMYIKIFRMRNMAELTNVIPCCSNRSVVSNVVIEVLVITLSSYIIVCPLIQYQHLKHDGTMPTCFNQSKASISFDYIP